MIYLILQKTVNSYINKNNNENHNENNKQDNEIINNGEILLKKLENVKKIGEYLEKNELDNINLNDENCDNDNKKDEIETDLVNIEKKCIKLAEDWIKYRTEKKNYLSKMRENLDKSVYGHDESKQQLERLIAQWMNGKMEGTVFGFQGPPGVGKTTLAKKRISKMLIR